MIPGCQWSKVPWQTSSSGGDSESSQHMSPVSWSRLRDHQRRHGECWYYCHTWWYLGPGQEDLQSGDTNYCSLQTYHHHHDHLESVSAEAEEGVIVSINSKWVRGEDPAQCGMFVNTGGWSSLSRSPGGQTWHHWSSARTTGGHVQCPDQPWSSGAREQGYQDCPEQQQTLPEEETSVQHDINYTIN